MCLFSFGNIDMPNIHMMSYLVSLSQYHVGFIAKENKEIVFLESLEPKQMAPGTQMQISRIFHKLLTKHVGQFLPFCLKNVYSGTPYQETLDTPPPIFTDIVPATV